MLIVNSKGTFVNRETTSKLTKMSVGLKQNSLSLPKKLEVLFNMNFEGMYGFMILTIEEENALLLGLKHHILPRNIDEIQITTQVEKLWQFNKKTIVSGIDPGTERTVKDSIRHATHSFLHSASSVCGSRTNQNFHKTLIKLKKDQSIKVCAFNKGNGIVIMNSKDYFDKLDKIIYDTSKFQEIIINTNLSHKVIRNENNIKNFSATKC